jgi:hypothetical protein
MIHKILIPTRCTFFFRNLSRENLWVNCACLRAILGGVSDWEIFLDLHERGQSVHKRLVLVCEDGL